MYIEMKECFYGGIKIVFGFYALVYLPKIWGICILKLQIPKDPACVLAKTQAGSFGICKKLTIFSLFSALQSITNRLQIETF
jgi:hypothetical protein